MIYGAGILVALVGLIAGSHSLPAGLGLLGFAAILLVTGGVLSYRNARRIRSRYQRLRISTGGKPGRRGIDDADSLSHLYGGDYGGGAGGGGGGCGGGGGD
ncbi:hypothetical protein ACFWUP_25410 [Nocardia sp. NPDC058658]|uniref:hypothetical protein n=1 Tax=Nocardia sp. NPDC058658 TaxID=3346580 RepID=UPI0036622AA8